MHETDRAAAGKQKNVDLKLNIKDPERGFPLYPKEFFRGHVRRVIPSVREGQHKAQQEGRRQHGCTAPPSTMSLFLVATLLLMSFPEACWSFVAYGQHKLTGKTRVRKHQGQRSGRTSTATTAHAATAGFVAGSGSSGGGAAAARAGRSSQPRYDDGVDKGWTVSRRLTDPCVLMSIADCCAVLIAVSEGGVSTLRMYLYPAHMSMSQPMQMCTWHCLDNVCTVQMTGAWCVVYYGIYRFDFFAAMMINTSQIMIEHSSPKNQHLKWIP